ncbi:bifunctional oligoribonuclease/PAP phosphatase NrnA [Lutibacter sp. B2]|nr:bifunctional oligoribonuclease/PAP phosphatase NrnA [Lutibacter sp. B2]
MNKNNHINEIVRTLQNAKNILILPHIMPDGDTIGSSMALYLALKKMNKVPYILLKDSLPSNIKFLEYEHIHSAMDENFIPDVVVAIDCSDLGRLKERQSYITTNVITINIDHHITNTHFADINFVFSQAAATGELIYNIIKGLNVEFDKKIATCIYTSLSTDTGNFKYDNTSSHTHRIAAELLEKEVDINFVSTQVYQNKSVSKVKLLKEVLNTLTFHINDKLAIMYVTKDMIALTESKLEDADGLTEFARDIEGIEVGVLLKQVSDHEIKVGLRSKYDIDVSKIAEKLGGGGHKKASGCTIFQDIETAKQTIIGKIQEYM